MSFSDIILGTFAIGGSIFACLFIPKFLLDNEFRNAILYSGKAITEKMTVMDIDQAGISTEVFFGIVNQFGFAAIMLKKENGEIEEYRILAKHLKKSEIRIGDICIIKHYGKKVLNFEIDKTARFK